jgi:hypothetical protein
MATSWRTITSGMAAGLEMAPVGFRMFYVRPDPAKWIECACGWREDLGVHYRVRSEPTPNLPAIQS